MPCRDLSPGPTLALHEDPYTATLSQSGEVLPAQLGLLFPAPGDIASGEVTARTLLDSAPLTRTHGTLDVCVGRVGAVLVLEASGPSLPRGPIEGREARQKASVRAQLCKADIYGGPRV